MALKRSGIVRRTPLAQTGIVPGRHRLAARAKRNSKQLPPVGPNVRQALLERQNGCCPHCDRPMRIEAAHVHHRLKRSQGGTNDMDNLLLVEATHHQDIHANVARSYELGHMVRRGDDPSAVRVRPISPHWTVTT